MADFAPVNAIVNPKSKLGDQGHQNDADVKQNRADDGAAAVHNLDMLCEIVHQVN